MSTPNVDPGGTRIAPTFFSIFSRLLEGCEAKGRYRGNQVGWFAGLTKPRTSAQIRGKKLPPLNGVFSPNLAPTQIVSQPKIAHRPADSSNPIYSPIRNPAFQSLAGDASIFLSSRRFGAQTLIVAERGDPLYDRRERVHAPGLLGVEHERPRARPRSRFGIWKWCVGSRMPGDKCGL